MGLHRDQHPRHAAHDHVGHVHQVAIGYSLDYGNWVRVMSAKVRAARSVSSLIRIRVKSSNLSAMP